jgi:hypothetical protein
MSLLDFINTPSLDAPAVVNKPAYKDWYKTVPKEKNSTEGYDLEAAYNELPYHVMQKFVTDPKAHLTDKYKTPSHITFSDQSKYHSPETPGGTWDSIDGIDYFYASKHNVTNAGGAKKLQKYFDKHEKGVKLIMPSEEF